VDRICSPPAEVSAGVQGQVVRARGLAGPRDTLEVTGPTGRVAYHLTLHGQSTEPVLIHLTRPFLPILLPLTSAHRRMWIMGVLCFLPVASTITIGWRAPSGNFPVSWDKIPPPNPLQLTSIMNQSTRLQDCATAILNSSSIIFWLKHPEILGNYPN
jgi:hypothetical protein